MKLSILAMLATFTTAFAAPAAAGETFPVEGKMLLGVNFWGSKAGIRMWRADAWDEASIEKDIAALAANGVELMRVFPTWSEFQPIRQEKKFQGAPALILRDGTDEEIYDPLCLDPGAVARFEKFCEIAERHNVRLENKNLITDPESVMWEGRFARAFVRRMKDKKAIVAWCLGNESNCMGAAESRAQAWMWLNTISSAIRMEDPSRPVVSGMHSQTSDGFGPQRGDYNKWTLQMQGELLDLLTPHPYPAAFRVEANRGPFNSFRNALHPASQCLFYSSVSGKPAFPQEVGSLGPRMSPDWMSAKGMRQQMFVCWAHGLGAYLWWCAFMQTHLDYPPYSECHVEPELGLLHADENRTPKPMAKELKAFRDFRDSLPFDVLPKYKTDAVCLVSEREEFYHQTFGAFMLSKAAGFDIEFVGADSRELPDSKFYILPSGKGWGTYSRKTWDELVDRVKKGATLLVSRGFETGYIDWPEITGLEQTTYHKWRKESFEFEGRKMSFSDSYTAEQKPIDCEVQAKDSSGNVVVSLKRLGKGKVIVVNFALEKCIIEQESEVVDNGFSNELWRIYAYAAREAGVKRCVTKDDPRLVVTEHPRKDGGEGARRPTIVVAVNTHDKPIECPVKVNGTVGRVWNGTYKDGTLSIRENDGCIFEVTNGN